MTEDEARKVGQALNLAGLPGAAEAVHPGDPGGAWCIRYEGRDVILASLDALIRHLGGAADASRTEPGRRDGRPVRGFVFPPRGQD